MQKTILCMLSSLIITTSAIAFPLSQVGDIQVGAKATITRGNGIASYYADGKKGKVQFTCDLEPVAEYQTVVAHLAGGKNFNSLRYNATLHQGLNGPFVWELTDAGERNGNIKISLISDSTKAGATIQCKGIFVIL